MVEVTRTEHRLGEHDGRTTLEQRFRFAAVSASALADLLMTAPLTGEASIFGDRPGEEVPRDGAARRLRGFSPAPGYQFDVDLDRLDDGQFVVRFSQPDRESAYLEGELLWRFHEVEGGAELDEQINTPDALDVVSTPLDGEGPSLRRWGFFRVGHAQVMAGATANLARLAGADG